MKQGSVDERRSNFWTSNDRHTIIQQSAHWSRIDSALPDTLVRAIAFSERACSYEHVRDDRP